MKTLVKLVFDDPRLVLVLVFFLVLAVIFKITHQPILVAISIWVGILASIFNAVRYSLQKASK